MKPESIWYRDIVNTFNVNNFHHFFPSSNMTYEQQLNSIVRFCVYFSILTYVIQQNINIFIVPIIALVATYCLYEYDKTNTIKDRFTSKEMNTKHRVGKNCVQPTVNNPFMNVLMTDYTDNPNRPVSCKLTDKTVGSKAKKHFEHNLYRDVDDIFHRKASDRQFYTTPITTIPNDSKSFAEWCYGNNKTCKEGNSTQCYNNLHTRHMRN